MYESCKQKLMRIIDANKRIAEKMVFAVLRLTSVFDMTKNTTKKKESPGTLWSGQNYFQNVKQAPARNSATFRSKF